MAALFSSVATSTPLPAWPGFNFDEWQNTTTWTKPQLSTSQTGRRELVPLLLVKQESPIDGIQAWEKKRSQTADVIRRILGTPTDLTKSNVRIESLGAETFDDHVRRHIKIRTEADDWIPAYLLLPEPLPKKPLPAMICVHQTVAQGKKEPCGIEGSGDLAIALQLVRRGYICLAPDMIGFGERIPAGKQPYHDSMAFYKKHPNWSFMGKMNWDVSRVVDYLQTLPEIDPQQIGIIGHSHGAYTSLFATAFEPRISVAIASCGFTTFRSDPHPDRWSHLTALIPQLGTYLPNVESIPFDWHDVCAQIAPRSVFVWYGLQDRIFPGTDSLDALFQDVRTVYGLYGAADDLAWHTFDGAHGFPVDGRARAYTWLGKRLFPLRDLQQLPTSLDQWNEQRLLIRRAIRRSIGNPDPDPPALDLQTVAIEKLPTYERRLIEYTVADNDQVRAYLSLPRQRKRPLPAVLVLHQTTVEGKRESVGIAGEKSLAFADELAKRGYITLACDSITAGERIDDFGPFDTRGHYLRYPDLSAMGKMLRDAQRAVDVLVQTNGVDVARLGVIGHSLGAEEALMLAAFDERIQATVASCGYATFAADSNPGRWARDHWFSYMPKLRPVLANGQLPPWDWGDVIRLVAPRAFYQHTTRDDAIFPESESAFAAAEAARAIWKLYDRPDRLVNKLNPGGHAVSPDVKNDIYRWLDETLH